MKILYAILIFLCVISGEVLAETADDYVSKGYDAYQKNDFATAAKLFHQACNGGEPSGCHNLGVMYANGDGVRQDYFKAVELYEKACNGGDAVGCNNLGYMYYHGRGVRADKQKALNLFGKSCDMKHQKACDNYAILKKELGQ